MGFFPSLRMTIDELAKHPWFSLPVASEEEMKKLFTERL